MNSFTRSAEHHTIPQTDAFDPSSGTLVERLLFNHRSIILGICVLLSLMLGYQALSLKLNAAFEKMIPTDHPYVQNYLKNRGQLGEGGNTLRIAVEARQGSIFDAAYLETVKKINDEVFLLPGVDRSYMKSLWTPATRWIGVTEEGFDGGPVIPDNYDGSAGSLDQVRQNVERSGEVGRLVALTSSPASCCCRFRTSHRTMANRWTTTRSQASSNRSGPSTKPKTSKSTSPALPKWWVI